MVRRCIGGTLTPQGQNGWVIPALPNDRGAQQCTESGGEVVESDTSSCGASTSSVGQMTGSTSSAMSLTTAVLDPVRRVRTNMSHTQLVRNLGLVNDSDELLKIVTSDGSIASRVAEGIGFLSSVCTAVLSQKSEDPMLRLKYDAQLHDWVSELARDVSRRFSNKDLQEALDQSVGILESYVGQTFGAMAADLNRGQASSQA